eukprot:GFKZ01009926.1.p1 GENE.GFKZ01009926.1~~GFKZ01009926.1.p1  ORF type:complete len:279 (+),score=21.78 GFKZ01009926.1:136-972(+)
MPTKRLHLSTPLFLLLVPIFFLGILSPNFNILSSQPSSPAPLPTQTSPCFPNVLLDIPLHPPPQQLLSLVSTLYSPSEIYFCHQCLPFLTSICNNSNPNPPTVILGALSIPSDLLACLRSTHHYYSATIARDPLERWSAAFISHHSTAPFSANTTNPPLSSDAYLQFMSHYPTCTLLHYYDQQGPVCADDDDDLARIEDILTRFDEILDPWAPWGGTLYKRLKEKQDPASNAAGFAGMTERPSRKFRAFLGIVRLAGELRLYRQMEDAARRDGGGVLC